MSEFLKNGGLADENTVIMNTQELEEKLRQAREAAIAEYTAAQAAGEGARAEDDYIIAPDEDAELTVRDTLLQDFGIEESVTPEPEPEPEPEPQPQPKRTQAQSRQPSEKAQRILAEKIRADRERKKKRVIIICAAVALALVVMLAVILLVLGNSKEQEYDELFDAGQSYYYAAEYDKALETLRQAMGIDKTDECLLLMSECYEAKNDYVNAIAILKSSAGSSNAIKNRIESLEKTKAELDKSSVATIGGEEYETDITALDLAGKSLKSSDLSELSKLTQLQSLKLAKNSVSSLECLEALTELQSLDLSNNKVSDLAPLTKLTKLRTLHLDNNEVKDYTPLYSLSKLTTLTISGMDINQDQLKELKKELPGCTVYSDEAKEVVTDISLGGKSFKSDVTELDLSGLGISDISALAACTKLTKLDLSGNSISSIVALLDMPELSWLDVSDNSIQDIRPVLSLSKLEYFDFSGNEVSSIAALAELTKLTELYLDGNTPKSLSAISDLTELTKLSLKNTGLDDKDLEKLYGLSKLNELNIEENDGLSKKGVDALQTKLPKCSILSPDLKDEIELGGKSFEADAKTVDASKLGISSISAVTEFESIQTLNLSDNKIRDISPLGALTTLETLDLRNNSISDLSALNGLSSLRALYLSGNPLTQEQISKLRTALPNCSIFFE